MRCVCTYKDYLLAYFACDILKCQIVGVSLLGYIVQTTSSKELKNLALQNINLLKNLTEYDSRASAVLESTKFILYYWNTFDREINC